MRAYCGLATQGQRGQNRSVDRVAIAVADDAGQIVIDVTVNDDAQGYAELIALLAEYAGDDGCACVPFATDYPSSLISRMVSASGRLMAIADPGDRLDSGAAAIRARVDSRAAVLAHGLALGLLTARPPEPPRALAGLRPLLASYAAIVSGHQSALASLRGLLRELYPAALREFPRLAEDRALGALSQLAERGATIDGLPAESERAIAGALREAVTAVRAHHDSAEQLLAAVSEVVTPPEVITPSEAVATSWSAPAVSLSRGARRAAQAPASEPSLMPPMPIFAPPGPSVPTLPPPATVLDASPIVPGTLSAPTPAPSPPPSTTSHGRALNGRAPSPNGRATPSYRAADLDAPAPARKTDLELPPPRRAAHAPETLPARRAPEQPYVGARPADLPALPAPPAPLRYEVTAPPDFGYATQEPPRRPAPSPTPETFSAEDELPIFAAARSAWFTGDSPPPAAVSDDWATPADDGWRAAEAASQPVTAGHTTTGLPRRVPQANLVPGAPADDQPLSPLSRDPNRLASITSEYFRGWHQAQGTGRRASASATAVWDSE